MPNDRVDESGKRFGRDMRRIREERNVSVDTIHESTRIAHTLIETFEESGLVDHPAFNRVYLRSFVRSYANAVDVAEEVALDALDAALDGEYTNQLAAHVLEEPPEDEASPHREPPRRNGDATQEGNEPSTSDDAPQDRTSADRASAGDAASEEAESAAGSVLATDVDLTDAENGKGDPSADDSSSASDASAREHPRMAAEGAPVRDRDAGPIPSDDDTADPESSAPEAPGSSSLGSSSLGDVFATNQRSLMLALIALGLLLLIGVGIWTAVRATDSSAPGASDPAQTRERDSLAQAGPVVAPSDAPVTLGDTLYLTVIAQRDVQGIRIKRDDDLRRPYWIEGGEATVFPFQQEAIVEQELSNVRLLLEGFPFPTARQDAQGRVAITRETAQSFVDTLRGDRPALSVTPDTNQIPAFVQ